MTVKAIRGRRRYLVFTVMPQLDRETLVHNIPGGKRFNVIQCAEGKAIVRCSPQEIQECSDAVRKVDGTAELVTLSGTLKTLRDKDPVLKRNAPPKPSRRKTPPSQPKTP